MRQHSATASSEVANHRPGPPVRRSRRRTHIAGALLAAVVLVLAACDPVGVTHPTQVNGLPTANTPHVTNGEVKTVAVAGDVVVLGGNFTQSTDPDGTVVNRSYLLAFNRNTGQILRNWQPLLNGEVFSVVAAPDKQSVYVGGRFTAVNGTSQLRVARIRVSDGSLMAFQSGFNAVVTAVEVAGDRLYVGGVFSSVQGRTRRFAGLDLETGAIDDDVNVGFAGDHNDGGGKIWRIEKSPNGKNLLVVGDFETVGGQARDQIVKLNTNDGGVMTVNPWATTSFAAPCGVFTDYVRDVSYSPDGTYFAVVTIGTYSLDVNSNCKSVSRWANNENPNATRDWVGFSGEDSLYSVEATGAAIYVGGHFRYVNNSYAGDHQGPGAVPREGIAALDPTNGLPLSWNPGRDRGRAVWQMVATPDGLYVASDTDRIARYLYRGRIAFFPLAGGKAVPQPPPVNLPIELEQHVPTDAGQPDRIASRHYDGTTFGTPSTTVSDASALGNPRASFMANGVLYTAHSDGTLRARSFDGTNLGPERTIELYNNYFQYELDDLKGIFYTNGRIYFTLDNGNSLFMRYFSTEIEVVGAERFRLDTPSTINYAAMGDMVLVSNKAYYVDRVNGTLVRANWSATTGFDPASRTVVAPANAGGISWTNSTLWARQGTTG